MRKQPNRYDLTEDEIKLLQSDTVPDDVRIYLRRQHANIGLKVSAYRKVAAAARAECDAILAARELREVHGDIVSAEQAIGEMRRLAGRNKALELQVAADEERIIDLTARAELRAVHSDD